MFIELLVLAISLFFILFVRDNFFPKPPRNNRPPGPFRLPFVGNALTLMRNRKIPAFVKFRNWSRKYGPVTYIKLGSDRTLDDIDIAKQLLNNEIWAKRPVNQFMLERSYGKPLGLIFASGESWREIRRFSIRSLRDFGLGRQSEMTAFIEEELDKLVTKLNLILESGSPVNFKHLFTMPVLNILWRMISSIRNPEDDDKLKQLSSIVDKLSKATATGRSLADIIPGLRRLAPDLTGATFIRKCIKEQQDYFQEVLDTRRMEGSYKNNSRDFIDLFLNEMDKHKELGSNPNYYTDEQFITVLTDLFEAGSETSSNTLEFAFYFIINNLKAQEKVQEEIDRVVGRSRYPNAGDRAQMPYAEATLLEIQRLANVLPMTARNPTEDCKVGGYFVEKGTLGIVNIYSIHTDERFWGDPFVFRPERFLDKDNNIVAEKAQRVIPFGAGKRVCLGEQMARTTLFTYFTAVLQNFKFEVVSPPDSLGVDPEEYFFDKVARQGFTLSPHPFQAKIFKR